MKLAKEKGRDLVCVAPQAIPPVCRILDYGKFRYELNKRDRDGKKKHHMSKLKEIKLKSRIEEHDYQVKLRKAIDFLSRGDKLRITLTFRGREMIRQEYGRKTLEKMLDDLKEYGAPESTSRLFGRRLIIVLSPTNTRSHSKPDSH